MKQKQVMIFLLMLIALLTACQSTFNETPSEKITVGGGSYTNVSAEELKVMLKNKDFLFINVHVPFEGDIADTDLSIPYDQITEPVNLSLLPDDNDAKIVLYCRSGRMSAIAAEALVKLGYTDIWNLDGGMVGWEQAGYSLEGQ